MDTDLRQSFLELPEAIRGWLTSERVMSAVAEINRELEYRGDMAGIVPWLITRLATKDLHPKYFIHELMEYTGEDFDRAKSITQEIDMKIFRRIETEFDRRGIDINALYLGKELPTGGVIADNANREQDNANNETTNTRGAKTQPFGAAQGREGVTADEAAISTNKQWGVAQGTEQRTWNRERTGRTEKDETASIEQAPSDIGHRTPDVARPLPAMPEGPVILHSEKDDVRPVAQPPITPKSKFSINIPRKYSTPSTPPPVTVRIETPDGPTIKQRSNEATKQSTALPAQNELPKIIKVVHYSNFRTPLDPRSVYKGHNV